MRFKNLKTGNFVSTDNPGTIALMKKSPNYEEVSEKKSKSSGKSKDKDKETEKNGEEKAEE